MICLSGTQARAQVETIDQILFETTFLGLDWSPSFGYFRSVEHPSGFVLNTGEVINFAPAVGFTIATRQQLASVTEQDGNIIYEFEAAIGNRMMLYGADLLSLLPEQESSSSARFNIAGPLQLVAEPGSTVASMSGELMLVEYDFQANFDPIYEPIPLSIEFDTIVPFTASFTILNSTWQLNTFDQPFEYELSGQIDTSRPDNLLGDFDSNGTYECSDIDTLVAAIASGDNSPAFDITGDGQVNIADLDRWRSLAGSENLGAGIAYPIGDANLDSTVDVSDFNRWNENRFSITPAWCSGDFNADGVVDTSDFNLWNEFKFTTASPSVVPEPRMTFWFAVAALAFLRRQRCL